MNWLDTLKNKIIKWLGGYTADEMQRTMHENMLKDEMQRQMIAQKRNFTTITTSVRIPEQFFSEESVKELLCSNLVSEIIKCDAINTSYTRCIYDCAVEAAATIVVAGK